MSNPSTIWAQLALPNPAAGALPYVGADNATICIDVLNYYYNAVGAALVGTGSNLANQLTVLNGVRKGYSDTTGVPGAAVINKTAGRVKLAAGQTSLVVTCSCAFLASIIKCQLEGAADATATRVFVSAQAAGTFTLTVNAACTAAVVISFDIQNVY